MKFILDDKIYKNPLKPTASKIIEYCSKMKDGQLFTTRKLAQELGFAYTTLRHRPIQKEYGQYAFQVSKNQSKYWGNPKTIKEFREYYESQTT